MSCSKNKNNIIPLHKEKDESLYFNCYSKTIDLDLLAKKLFIEIGKIDTLLDIQWDLSEEIIRRAFEKRNESLKVIAFDLHMIKHRYKR